MIFSAWLAATLSLFDGTSAAPMQLSPDQPPVLLIHGISDSERNMQWLARHLRQEGREVHTLNLTPNWGQKGLGALAQQIDTYAQAEFGHRKFDLVGFSMGGLVSRYYVQRLGGIKRVNHLVTISAPHNGTVVANLIGFQGCREMRPGSAFLVDLNTDVDRLRTIKFTSLYTPLDLIILPARSSEMPQARNIRILNIAHPFMIFDRRCLRAVSDALKA